MKITIIGGGVNGVCSAYYLNKAGFKVEIIDSVFSDQGTSYGNAGMIVPSHFVPMASPGVISKGIRWMFNSSSPFFIRPRMDFRLMQWLWKFYKSCNDRNVLRNQELIWNYNQISNEAYKQIRTEEKLDFDYKENGLLMLFRNEKSKKEEIELAHKAEKLGLNVEILDTEGVQRLNPDTIVDVLGGVYYPSDAQIYPNVFMNQLISMLRDSGVDFIQKRVDSFEYQNDLVKKILLTDGEALDVETLVISAGVWTGDLLRRLGIKLLLEDGKGYSITKFNCNNRPSIPSILTDEKVAITPMGNDLRITGTLEISGIDKKINKKRIQSFLRAVPEYFPQISTETSINDDLIWTGYRPLSPDGVPYVGRSEKIENLIVATGHGMMGMSLGPGTGLLVSNIVQGNESPLDLNLMKLER